MATCPACGEELPERVALRGFDRLHGTPGSFEVHVCDSCGSGRTFPLVPSGELARFYPESYNAYALPSNRLPHLLATALFRRRYGKALRRGPLRALRGLPPGRLLDVGAGRGDLGVVLGEHGWQVTGLEPSADACKEGRRRGVSMVHGTLGTATAAELGTGYDAVVFQHALEHVVEPRTDLGRTLELLRPGGLLLVTLPNFGSWQSRRFGSAWFHLDLPRHRAHFTAAGVERLLGRTGFTDVRTTTSTSADGLPMSLQYRAFGGRRFQSGAGRYAFIAATLAALPVT